MSPTVGHEHNCTQPSVRIRSAGRLPQHATTIDADTGWCPGDDCDGGVTIREGAIVAATAVAIKGAPVYVIPGRTPATQVYDHFRHRRYQKREAVLAGPLIYPVAAVQPERYRYAARSERA